MGRTAGPKRGPGTQSPHPADRDYFLFQHIYKICYVGPDFFFSFLQLHFILKIDLSMMLQYSLAEAVNRLQYLGHDKV